MISKEQVLILKGLIDQYAHRLSNHGRHANEITQENLANSVELLNNFLNSITECETND